MKEDCKHIDDEKVRELSLNVKSYPLSTILEDDLEAMEEAHYVHTINAFVELVIMYGSAKVLDDLDKALLGAKE